MSNQYVLNWATVGEMTFPDVEHDRSPVFPSLDRADRAVNLKITLR